MGASFVGDAGRRLGDAQRYEEAHGCAGASLQQLGASARSEQGCRRDGGGAGGQAMYLPTVPCGVDSVGGSAGAGEDDAGLMRQAKQTTPSTVHERVVGGMEDGVGQQHEGASVLRARTSRWT